MVKLGLDPKQLECKSQNPTPPPPSKSEIIQETVAEVGAVSPEQIDVFASDPEKWLAFRKIIEADGNTIHEASFAGSGMQRSAVEAFRAAMSERLARKPEIADFLIPAFAVGCRRTTPGPGYLEALVESNVEFVTDPVSEVGADAVVLKSGRRVAVDALVCATGFRTSAAPPFPIVGRGGLSLRERFAPYPEAYLSVAVDSFPNLFLMLGPNSATGTGSLTTIIESEGDYIVKCIRKLQKEDYASMAVRPDRMADWRTFCHEYFKQTVYSDRCNSWYKSSGPGGERITGLWPGSALHSLEALRSPRWEDYEFESREGEGGNLLRWLGNGYSVTHTRRDGGGAADGEYAGDPAWYVEPQFVSVPVEERPEEDPEFRMRPFSH